MYTGGLGLSLLDDSLVTLPPVAIDPGSIFSQPIVPKVITTEHGPPPSSLTTLQVAPMASSGGIPGWLLALGVVGLILALGRGRR
jgi:hypothetical protein